MCLSLFFLQSADNYLLCKIVLCHTLQIGNAVLNDATDQLGMVEYAWSHAIISDELYSTVRNECNSFKEEGEGGRPSKACSPAIKAFLEAYNDIDIYSIYSPICLSSLSKSYYSPSAKLAAAPHFFSQHVSRSILMNTKFFSYNH